MFFVLVAALKFFVGEKENGEATVRHTIRY